MHTLSQSSRHGVDAVARMFGIDGFDVKFPSYDKMAGVFSKKLDEELFVGIGGGDFMRYRDRLFYDGVESVLPEWDKTVPIKLPF